MVSVNLPENGLLIAAETVKRVMINPFLSAPPSSVIKEFNSGKMRLKLVMKKNMDKDKSQKFFPYLYVMRQNYVLIRM